MTGGGSNARFIRAGLPLMGAVLAGSFGFAHFQQNKYTFRKQKTTDLMDELKVTGLEVKSSITNKDLLKQHLSEVEDTSEYVNVRGPREWEDNTAFEDMKRKRQLQRLIAKLEHEIRIAQQTDKARLTPQLESAKKELSSLL